jgi:hypothetical protein
MSKGLQNRAPYLPVMLYRLLKILTELIISQKAGIEFAESEPAEQAVNDDFRASCFSQLRKKQDPELTMIRSAGNKLNSTQRSLPYTQLISYIKFQGSKPGLNILSVEAQGAAAVHT